MSSQEWCAGMVAIAEIEEFAAFEIARDRDQFLRELIRELSGTLEEVVGAEDAAGFISVVGARLGEVMNDEYCSHASVKSMSLQQIAACLIDLKQRIQGDFQVESISAERIVLVNSRCPFGDYVNGRPSLCMMTSNVFGRIAAQNTGYAEVAIPEAIAKGDKRCRVVVSFTPTSSDTEKGDARDYYACA
jgi:predicted ArsR family transcriptional regulator